MKTGYHPCGGCGNLVPAGEDACGGCGWVSAASRPARSAVQTWRMPMWSAPSRRVRVLMFLLEVARR